MKPLREILEEHRIEFQDSGHHHTRPGWLQLRHCPFCGSDNFHLGLNLQFSYFHCWRCGGHPRNAVFKALKIPPISLQGLALAKMPMPSSKTPAWARRGLKEPRFRTALQRPHRDYLRSRGLDPGKTARFWELEGIAIAPKLGWRIYIPIVFKGKRVSWTTRAIGNRSQRYISASASDEIIPHKSLIYGRDHCVHSIIVCEGPFDVWKIGPGAGALFGTAFTTAQVNILSRVPRRFICLDDDAKSQARKLADQLSCFPGVTTVVELDAKDPGEASEKEIRLLRRVARLD